MFGGARKRRAGDAARKVGGIDGKKIFGHGVLQKVWVPVWNAGNADRHKTARVGKRTTGAKKRCSLRGNDPDQVQRVSHPSQDCCDLSLGCKHPWHPDKLK